ncbi:MAG: ATP-binding protein [Ktedonobacteraceae bacterium]
MDDLDQTSHDQWQKNNEAYLGAALSWLRLRLEQKAGPLVPTLPVPQPARGRFFERRASVPANSFGVIPSLKAVTDADVTKAANAMKAAAAPQPAQGSAGGSLPPPALVVLSQLLELSSFEQHVLLLCIAMELDTTIANLCARIHGDANRAYPTFALALAVFTEERSWDVLSPERPLRRWRLIEINQPGAQPLTTSPLRADERIVNFVKGLHYLDDRLASLVVPLEVDEKQVALPTSQQEVVDAIVRNLQQAYSAAVLPVIQLVGPDAPSKQLIARQAVARFGRHLYRIPVEMLPTQAADLETLARLWQRESILMPWALYLDAQEIDGDTTPELHQAVSSLTRFLARSEGIFFVGVREIWSRLGRPHIALDVAMPTTAEQKAAWAEALGTATASSPDNPGLLSSQFNLNLTTIQNIAQAALAEKAGDEQALAARLWDACRVSTRPRLDTLAQRLETKATWDDLVLPDEETKMLRRIADQVSQRSRVYEEWGFANKMNRGLGINALFAGESGTGKTMAAEVMANDLRLNLYRIDLSAVVSKYIGETEKNLRRLFDAAEYGGAILFFDEADALFGKRSEVKDSHDRYANIEINYLLQRMEAYKGLAILATNMKSALDPAFMRRLRFIVTFPFPGPAERKRMWQKVFPKDTPTNGLDYDWLARFNLNGGSIHNIALNAAFLAAQSSPAVTMPLVLEAARSEFRKMERPINEAEFRWKVPQGANA